VTDPDRGVIEAETSARGWRRACELAHGRRDAQGGAVGSAAADEYMPEFREIGSSLTFVD
jgi:hypothetical protein